MDNFDSLQRADEWARNVDADAPRRVRSAVKLARQWANDPRSQNSDALKQAAKLATRLRGLIDTEGDVRQRVHMAAHLAEITPQSFCAAIHYLAYAAAIRPSVAPVDGAQGRTSFTRFVRALDRMMMGVYGLPELPGNIVVELLADLFDDHRSARDVEIVRARPYVDDAGAEIGEIVPEYQTK